MTRELLAQLKRQAQEANSAYAKALKQFKTERKQ
jgi:hypothetical protein